MREFKSLLVRMGKRKFFLIFGLAFLLRITLLIVSSSQGESSFYLFDSYRYMNLGDHLFEEGIYAEKTTEPVFKSIFTPPGAPVVFYLLKSIGGIKAIILFHIFCQLLICYYLLKCIQLFYPNAISKIGLIAGLLFALDIPTIVMGNVLMTETLFTLFLLLSVYHQLLFFQKNNLKNLIIGSALMGAAALIRPIILYFPFFLIVFFIFLYFHPLKLFLKKSICLLVPFYSITGIWFYCNYVMFGSFFFSYVGDFNLAYFQASAIYADKYEIKLSEAREKLYHETLDELKDVPEEEVNQIVFYDALGKQARKVVLENPSYFIKNASRAFIHLFFRPVKDYLKITLGSNELFHTRSKNNSLFIQLTTYWQILVSVLVFVFLPFGLRSLFKINKTAAVYLFLFLMYFILVCSGPEIEGRFRVPLVPVLLFLSSIGAFQLIEKLKKKNFPASTDNTNFAP